MGGDPPTGAADCSVVINFNPSQAGSVWGTVTFVGAHGTAVMAAVDGNGIVNAPSDDRVFASVFD